MNNDSFKKFEETTVSSERIFSGEVIKVERDDILLPDGNPGFREVVRHNGAVCVVPVTDEGEIVVVRQYRYPFSEVLTEIPAGKLDSKDEIPEDAARRELREETGAVAGKLDYLGKFYATPAIFDEVIHMYVARDLTFGATDLDEDEFVETDRIPVDTFVDMIMRGEITDGKTQAAVLRAALFMNRLISADKAAVKKV